MLRPPASVLDVPQGSLRPDCVFEQRHAGPSDRVDHLNLCHTPDVAVALEIGSLLHFFEGYALGLVNLEAPLDEVLELHAHLLFELLIPDVPADAGLELLVVLAVQQRLLAVQHLVDEHPERPNVGLRAVLVLHVSLGRHVERRADAEVAE